MQVVLILKFEFTAAFMTPGGSVFATIAASLNEQTTQLA